MQSENSYIDLKSVFRSMQWLGDGCISFSWEEYGPAFLAGVQDYIEKLKMYQEHPDYGCQSAGLCYFVRSLNLIWFGDKLPGTLIPVRNPYRFWNSLVLSTPTNGCNVATDWGLIERDRGRTQSRLEMCGKLVNQLSRSIQAALTDTN